MKLVTDRLVLREWKLEDAEDLYEYAKLPQVGPNAGWKPHESVEESRKIINMFIAEKNVLAMQLKETDKVIGSVGLNSGRKIVSFDYDYELGYVLSADYWGKGLMTEACRKVLDYAFNEKNAGCILVSHFPSNNRSRRVIEKLGFEYILTKEQSFRMYDGKEMDQCIYYMTKSAYEYTKAK